MRVGESVPQMKEALGQEVKEKNNSEEGNKRYIMRFTAILHCVVQYSVAWCGVVYSIIVSCILLLLSKILCCV